MDSSTVQAPADVPPLAEPGWLRGDLHWHTLHSDGDSWPAEMLAEAVARGLDFLGVTDHNQVGHLPLLPAGEAIAVVLRRTR